MDAPSPTPNRQSVSQIRHLAVMIKRILIHLKLFVNSKHEPPHGKANNLHRRKHRRSYMYFMAWRVSVQFERAILYIDICAA